MKFTVALANDSTGQGLSDAPSSLSDGRYGFSVHATGIDDAEQQVLDRAKLDGLIGCGWLARITGLDSRGRMDTGFFGENDRWIRIA